ncbi:MAG: ATP-binding protein [Candidatus Bathyarchaeia archaeon]
MSEWDVDTFLEEQTVAIGEALGQEKALIAVSGGVDSTVSALLTHRAIGDNLICVFIDDNFMRLGEPEQVRSSLTSEPLNLPVRVLNEKTRFMEALEGLIDAEEKRHAFRETFYEVLGEVAEDEGCKYLVQGTIKADVDETSGGVKTQHNVLEQIGIDTMEKFGFTVIEPLKTIYKSQVRELARFMGVPPEVSERQPFPGPGLSIRAVGEVTQEKLDELKKANFIVEEEFEPYGPAQYFAAIFSARPNKELKVLSRDAIQILGLEGIEAEAGLLPERATGIVDGKRAYGKVMAMSLRDLAGEPVFPDYEDLPRIRAYINDNYPEVSRTLFRVKYRKGDGYVVAMRAVETRDYLTAKVDEIPWRILSETASRILDNCRTVKEVYYDVTPKPPATIEYE